jgi:peroxiredoxin Q/BCP
MIGLLIEARWTLMERRTTPSRMSILKPFTLLALLGGCAVPAASEPAHAPTTTTAAAIPAALAVGSPAPEFSAQAHDGTQLKLSALRGKHVVLYFYPKDETPGCTKEACAFRDAWEDLEATGAVLVGISTDSVDSHKRFAEHHELPFHLVSDADMTIAKAYGVPDRYRAMNGVEYSGILARQTVVIGPDGAVKKIYRTVDLAKHVQEVLHDVR